METSPIKSEAYGPHVALSSSPAGFIHSKPRATLSRRAKVLLVLLTAAVTTTLQYCWSATDQPQADSNAPEFNWFALEPSRSIQWAPCYSGEKCARLLLPLDYDTLDGPTTAIALRMIPAQDKDNYRGPILINPGGPGGSGTNLIARAGRNISRVVGDSFDILGFDPRGIGASTPSANCFDSDSQRKLWALQDEHRLLNASDDTLPLVHARIKTVARRCEEKIGGEWGIGRFMSTAHVSRDMLEISKQLGHGKLQYWGFSYGSILGQYFSAIYPKNVGRVIIDGVYDSHNYRGALWNSNLVDADAVIDSFFHFCHQAGPEKCSLYESSPEKIRDRYFSLLAAVEAEPVPVANADPPLIITRKVLQSQLFRGAYKPLAAFGLIADTILALERKNATALAALAPKIADPTECECECALPPEPWRASNEAFEAVACGDADARAFDAGEYGEYFGGLARESALAAPLWAETYIKCAEWRVRPKGRWTGPLEATNTSHPILVVAPRYDPVCPMKDGKTVHERFGGSGLLIQNSYGHCSLAAPSLCTAKHVRAYMVNGTIPEPGTECEVDELPFVGSVNNVHALSAEDAELLEALKGLSSVVPTFGMP
ncbi:alpha/beta-hydrolase [Trametes polyzona]|nr:alpha/beta-hydrolase [Trametes polyzona]